MSDLGHPVADGPESLRPPVREVPPSVAHDRPSPTVAATAATHHADGPTDEAAADQPASRWATVLWVARLPFVATARLWSLLMRPFEFLIAVTFAFFEAVSIQVPERRWTDLIQAWPAWAIAVVAVSAGGAWLVCRPALTDEYHTLAAAAEAGGDFASLRVYAGRLYDLGGSPEALFQLAKADDRLNRAAEAESIMRRLADEHGYGPAILWTADRTLASTTVPNEQRLDALIRRLRQAEAAGAEPRDIAPRLARALLALGDTAAALPYLERAAGVDAALRIELAAAYARLGRAADARDAAAAAEGELRRRVEADPGDLAARARWVSCLLNLGDPAAAIAACGERTDDPTLADLYVLACLAREAEIEKTGGPPEERLSLIRRALLVRPASEPALLRLVEFRRTVPADQKEKADRLLSDSLARDDLPASVYVVLGSRAWSAGDEADALAYLRRAYDADPSNLVAANNVAWLLARRPGPDRDEALAIADRLVAERPEVAQFHDTRGQILAKAGRWDEALVELERALPAMRGSVETRRTLAEAYRRIGRPGLAERQTREADRLESASPRGRPAAGI